MSTELIGNCGYTVGERGYFERINKAFGLSEVINFSVGYDYYNGIKNFCDKLSSIISEVYSDVRNINKDSLVEFELCNTDDITYEIIYQGEVADVPEQVQAQVEPRHAHKLVDITLKEHKKKSNGSCVTTYYEGQKCSTCGTVWKGDVINTVTMAKCTH